MNPEAECSYTACCVSIVRSCRTAVRGEEDERPPVHGGRTESCSDTACCVSDPVVPHGSALQSGHVQTRATVKKTLTVWFSRF